MPLSVLKWKTGFALLLPAFYAFLVPGGPDAGAHFARNYTVGREPHLKIAGFYGNIRVSGWDRDKISIQTAGRGASIQDRTIGNSLIIRVTRGREECKVDFDVYVPEKASLSIESRVGDVSLDGIGGHVTIDAGDGSIKVTDSHSPSIDARVTNGDVFFDGLLPGPGPYSFQSFRGDIDITVPTSESFHLVARSMAMEIDLGGFSLDGLVRSNRFTGGRHESHSNCPALNLSTYAGRISLHKR